MTAASQDHNRAGVEAAMRGDLGSAEQSFRRAFQQTPSNPGVFLNLTRLLQMQKRHRELIQLFRTSFSKRELNNLPSPLKCMVAQSAYQISDYKLIIDLLADIETQYRQRADITIPLSEAYLRSGLLSEAKSILQNALLSSPSDPSLMTNLAIVETEQGQYKAAEILYQKVTQLYPSQFLGYYNLGRFYQTLGRVDEARQAFEMCLKLVPNAPEAKKALNELDAAANHSASSTQDEDGLQGCYSAIEAKKWQLACDRLRALQHHVDHIRWVAAICELPQEWQSEFGNPTTYEPSHLVQTTQLFKTTDGLLTTLIEEIRNLDSLVWNRAGKPTREGFQTHEILAGGSTAAIQTLNQSLTIALKSYIEKGPDLPLPVQPDPDSISGWGVILKTSGYQKRHIHPEANISGVLYLSVDETTASETSPEGNLLFSTPNPLQITPKAGRVVLFPSFLPHETIPFTSTAERICIAFNFS